MKIEPVKHLSKTSDKSPRKCPKCGIELSDVMMYVCSTSNCPVGLGSRYSL